MRIGNECIILNVALFENTVDSSQLLSCFKEGPTSKFIGIKNLKLSGLNIQGQASGLSTLSHSSEVFGVRTSSFRPISPPPSSVAIASSYFTAAPVSHGLETKIMIFKKSKKYGEKKVHLYVQKEFKKDMQ